MDTTENFGLPYPQCDPPLTKDASDIEQLRDLAVAVDDLVQDYADLVDQYVVHPGVVRMTAAAVGPINGGTITLPMTATTFDTPGGMAEIANGGIRIQADGWYQVGWWITGVQSGVLEHSTRAVILVNGEVTMSPQGPAGYAQANTAQLTATEAVHLFEGDLLTLQVRLNVQPAQTTTITGAMWAWTVARDV